MPPCCLFYSSYFTNLYSFFIEVICMKYTFLPYYFLLCIFQQISKIQKSVLSNTNRSVIVELYFNVSPGYNPMLEFIRWLSVSIQNGKRSEGRDPPSAWQSVETQPQPWQGEHWTRLDTADRWQPTTGWNPQSKRVRRKTKPIITQTLKASSRLVKNNCILPWCAPASYS